MATLSPSGGDLIETTELAFTGTTVSAVGFSEVTEWTWTLVPITAGTPDGSGNFTIAGSGLMFAVDYVSELGLFPLQYVRYQTPERTLVEVDSWDAVPGPADAPQITKMREDTKDLVEWQLDITATGLDMSSPPKPVTASGSYVLRVFANYDTSRDRLVDAINAKR